MEIINLIFFTTLSISVAMLFLLSVVLVVIGMVMLLKDRILKKDKNEHKQNIRR